MVFPAVIFQCAGPARPSFEQRHLAASLAPPFRSAGANFVSQFFKVASRRCDMPDPHPAGVNPDPDHHRGGISDNRDQPPANHLRIQPSRRIQVEPVGLGQLVTESQVIGPAGHRSPISTISNAGLPKRQRPVPENFIFISRPETRKSLVVSLVAMVRLGLAMLFPAGKS